MAATLEEPPCPDLSIIHRFTVTSIDRTLLPESLVLNLTSSSPYKFKCILRGKWAETKLAPGDIVNIKTDLWEGAFIVDYSSGFVIVNPDYMIPCTSIATSLFCERKAWLNEKFKGWGAGNEAMLVGTIVHEVLQECCMKKIYDSNQVYSLMYEMVQRIHFIIEAYACGMTQQELQSKVTVFAPWICEFIEKYVTIKGESELHETPRTKLKILDFIDVEDNIWCRYFGVKGKVDFTVHVRVLGSDFSVKKKYLPMELKTGKVSFSPEHTAQATLYTLMMNERQYGECDSGLLLYLKDGPKLKEIALPITAKQTIIQRRNDYEYMMRRWSDGPEFKDNTRTCTRCEHLLDCSLMAKNFEEDKLFETNCQEEIVTTALEHLVGAEIEFFGNWVKKLNSKSNSAKNSTVDFWNTPSEDQEDIGTALAKMIITRHKKFTYTFVRSPNHTKKMKPLNEILRSLNGRERVALSIDEVTASGKRDMIAILTGFIEKIENDSVTCTFDKALQDSLYKRVFRIDLLGRGSYSNAIPFSNLLRLMTPDTLSSTLRQAIILGEPASYAQKVPQSVANHAKELLKLGDDASQKESLLLMRKAVAHTLTSSQYILISYSSNESKFKYIRILLGLLDVWGKRGLIVSPNATNLDEILLDLAENSQSKFVRLGSTSKMDPKLEKYSSEHQLQQITSISEIEPIYKNKHIASTFYYLTNHVAYENSPEPFEYCIIDQVDLVSLPNALGPLFRSNKFVLLTCDQQTSSQSSEATSTNESTPTSDLATPSPANATGDSAGTQSTDQTSQTSDYATASSNSTSSAINNGPSTNGTQTKQTRREPVQDNLFMHLQPISHVYHL